MTILMTPANEAEWLSWRTQDLTSTDVAALFGLSPYATAFEVWHRKKSGNADALADNDRMQAGRHIEPAIASLVAEREGVEVEPFKVYARDEADRLGSSFDYVIKAVTRAGSELATLVHERGPGVLECKNVDFLAFRQKWTEDECPAHIEIQLQHQLELTGYEWGAVAALVGGNTVWLYIRLRDEAVGRAIRIKAREFWRSIDAGQAPDPVMPDDADAVIALYQYAEPGKVLDARGDAELENLVREYHRIGKEIDDLELIRKTHRAHIMERIGDASKVLLPSYSLSASQTADSPGKPITADMVGQMIGARRGFRALRVTPKKPTE